ncbi:hypothetical protein AVEN_35023-1 [Araneus ventricosus]|uniref:Uncharacterized protein n=1 Tax=Araneus ventricosus TaxID=182803 RepID=A0A4Y2I026_ARAVE|nr:hypothetical protein AVEN_35023-1 [Araneus ventricosus]
MFLSRECFFLHNHTLHIVSSSRVLRSVREASGPSQPASEKSFFQLNFPTLVHPLLLPTVLPSILVSALSRPSKRLKSPSPKPPKT